jgi:glyoxylase-like metal-dependent hydrolase (beta-lactamase superfamily II)
MRIFAAIAACVFCISIIVAGQQPAEPLNPEWCRRLPRPEYKALERVATPDPWFEVYRIRPGVFAIYEPHQFEEVISYLIVGEKRALLFDTGIGVGKMRAVVESLTKLPLIVLNSHTHFDHVGGNAEFSEIHGSEIYGEDTSYSRSNAAGRMNAYSSDALIPERVCGKLPDGVKAEKYAIRPWKVTHVVHDEERIDLGSRELEILFTPGHTPDALSLLDRRNGLLFTGDTYYPGPIYLFVPETDLAAYTRSITRLATLSPGLSLLLPAHNVPVADPKALRAVEAALKKVKDGSARWKVTDGNREYEFEGFSLLLSGK